MSKKTNKDRIVEELRKTKEAGQITAEKVHKILEEVVSDVVVEGSKDVKQLRSIVKDAVDAAITGLKETEADTKETVGGAVEGAIAGTRNYGDQVVKTTQEEIRLLETRLVKERAQLTENLAEGLEGASDAGETLSGDTKEWLGSAVVDIKLKSTQLLGLTRQTVKEAKKTTSTLRQKARDVAEKTADKVANKLKRTGKDATKKTTKAASAIADETRELGKKSVNIAKGAMSGMWEGAKDALKKEKENK